MSGPTPSANEMNARAAQERANNIAAVRAADLGRGNEMEFTCRHCHEAIERRESDETPGRMEWVTKFGNDPQCDASPSDNHGPDTVRVNVKDVVADLRGQREGNEMKTVNVTAIGSGMFIVNVGQVVGTRPEGAFVFVSIEGQTWDATRGIQVPTFETRFYHASDEVTVLA